MSAPAPNYVHRARLARQDEIPKRATPVHDGDSFYLRIDLGTYCGVRVDPVVYIRLKGIDTFELSEPLGKEARDAALEYLTLAGRVTVATEKPIVGGVLGSTLGRTVAQVWVDDQDLAELLRTQGLAKEEERLG